MKTISKNAEIEAAYSHAFERSYRQSAYFKNTTANGYDYIVFVKAGDFYETFGDDATICARLLGLTIYYRMPSGKRARPYETGVVQAAGLPFHSIAQYAEKLVNKGFKVAIIED